MGGLPKALPPGEGDVLAASEPEDDPPWRVAVLEEEPPPPKRTPNERLVIPEDATSLSFMEGCWMSKGSIYNTDKVPVAYIYCFNKKGGADVYIEEKDSNGRIVDTCRGKAAATLSDKVMRITDDGLKCGPGNGSYIPINVACRNAAT